MNKKRIDILLVELGLAESRTLAQRFVMAGEVRADGEMVHKPSALISPEANIEILEKPPYVSRGGLKLAAALQTFEIKVVGKTCADVGASTGGFTDCLLQNGAKKVYAIDVGYGVLHWKMRQDERVVVMERINVRFLDQLPEHIDLVTIDASFISLSLILPKVFNWIEHTQGEAVGLIKPQFEAGQKEAALHAGVIKDRLVHERVLKTTLTNALKMGFFPIGLIPSPIRGPKGNQEFLVYLTLAEPQNSKSVDSLVEEAMGMMPG